MGRKGGETVPEVIADAGREGQLDFGFWILLDCSVKDGGFAADGGADRNRSAAKIASQGLPVG
jgi:hypothetical protein